MMKSLLLGFTALSVAMVVSGCSDAGKPSIEIKNDSSLPHISSSSSDSQAELPFSKYYQYELFELQNGLRVIVHEDKTKQDVAVVVYVHVGSKDEPKGRSGFAHVFEHLAFNGTKKNPGEFFEYLDEIGAYYTNGSTGTDLTNYFQVVPKGSLERMLWLEADRMMNAGNDATQESLETQIDVIKNEKRLGENAPFGESQEEALRAMYPYNHPYSHTTIGSEVDLEAATLEDVRAWYKKYYGAANTVLVLAGNVDGNEGRALAEKYFGNIPSGPTLTKMEGWHIDRDEITVQHNYDTAPISSLDRSYSLPAIHSSKDVHALLAFFILGAGEASFLHERLVDDLGVAIDVYAGGYRRELDTYANITVRPAKDVSLDELGKHLDEAIAEFLEQGPEQADIDRIYGAWRSNLLFATDDLVSKALTLGSELASNDDPHRKLRFIDWMRQASPQDVLNAAKKVLPRGYHEEHNIALEERKSVDTSIADVPAPPITVNNAINIPDPNVFKLANGLEVVHIERRASPQIKFDYVVPVGSSNYNIQDQEALKTAMEFAAKAGNPKMDSTTQYSTLQSLGAVLTANVDDRATSIDLVTDSEGLRGALSIYTGVLSQTSFAEKDMQDFLDEKVQRAKRDQKDVDAVSRDIISRSFHGDSNTFTAKQRGDLYAKLKASDLQQRVRDLVKPDGAKLYVVGDISSDELKAKLARALDSWTGSVSVPAVASYNPPETVVRPKFMLINDEGVDQTAMIGVRRLENSPDIDNYISNFANSVVGSGFTSRLNMNIREDKGWAYGIRHSVQENELFDITVVQGSVTAEHTISALKEIQRELTEVNGARPITDDELAVVVNKKIKGYNSNTEDNTGLLGVLKRSDELGVPYDYFEQVAERYENVTTRQVSEISSDLFGWDDYHWVLVGDLNLFEKQLRDSGLGDVEVYDLDGKVIR